MEKQEYVDVRVLWRALFRPRFEELRRAGCALRSRAGACGCKSFGKCRTKKTQGVCVMWGASNASTHNQDEHNSTHTHTHTVLHVSVKWPGAISYFASPANGTHRRLHDVCRCVYERGVAHIDRLPITHSRLILIRPPLIITVRSTAVKASASSPLQHGMRLDSALPAQIKGFIAKERPNFTGMLVAPTKNARIPRPCPQSVTSCCWVHPTQKQSWLEKESDEG